MPRNLNPPIRFRSTPRRLSRSTASGISPSPQAPSIGGRPRSITATESPARRAAIAVARPIGPPPTISTSTTSATSGLVEASTMGLHLLFEPQAGVGEAGPRERPGEAQGGDLLRRGQLARQVQPERLTAAQLAGGSAGKRPGRQENQLPYGNAYASEHRVAAGARQIGALLWRDPPRGFDQQHELLRPPLRAGSSRRPRSRCGR